MKLIDADKLLRWLDSKEASPLWEGPEGLLKYSLVVGEISDGAFDPDDISEIKVGDRVWCEDHKCAGKVVIISNNGRYAYVDWDRLLFTGSIQLRRLKLMGRESIPKEDTKG